MCLNLYNSYKFIRMYIITYNNNLYVCTQFIYYTCTCNLLCMYILYVLDTLFSIIVSYILLIIFYT